MIAEVDGKIALNAEKWYRVAKRGEKPTKAHMEAYVKLGGAVIEAPKKKVVKKKKAKK